MTLRSLASKPAWRAAAWLCIGAALVLLPGRSGGAQQIQFGGQETAGKKAHVVLLTETAQVTAGVPQEVELRFRVEAGFHINSHTPKDELLIPTAFKLEPGSGLKLSGEEYPAGTAFRLEVGDGETLDVYQNEFRVRLKIVAPRGSTTLLGALHYQACDNAACFPPRTLPVKVLLTGK